MNLCGNPSWSGTKSLQLIPKKDGFEPRFVVLVPEIQEYKKKSRLFLSGIFYGKRPYSGMDLM
jgi:hypothetical protein